VTLFLANAWGKIPLLKRNDVRHNAPMFFSVTMIKMKMMEVSEMMMEDFIHSIGWAGVAIVEIEPP
jgi:hypothetical protein